MPNQKKAAVAEKACVGCGECTKHCPRGTIQILRGVHARVNPSLCIGCEKCRKACPASVIEMRDYE